jgi:hypothetical protein
LCAPLAALGYSAGGRSRICRFKSSRSQRLCLPAVLNVGVTTPSRSQRASVDRSIDNALAASPVERSRSRGTR